MEICDPREVGEFEDKHKREGEREENIVDMLLLIVKRVSVVTTDVMANGSMDVQLLQRGKVVCD